MSYLGKNNVRIALGALGLLGALFTVAWVPLACMALLAVRFRAWEVLGIGLLVDFLWLPTGSFFFPLPLFSIAGLFLVWGPEPLRTQFLLFP